MDIRVEDKNSYTKSLILVFDAEEIKQRYDEKVKKYLPKIQVPGFRAGKAPKSLIRAKFGDALMEEIQQEILQKDLQEAIEKNIDNPIGLSDIEPKPIEFDETYEVNAEVEVKPIIEVKKFKGLEIEKPFFKSSEEDIDTAIENIRTRSATLEEVDKEADMEDYLVVKLNGDMKYLPLTDDVPDETLKKLLGLKKGDNIENDTFVFPVGYIDKTLEGKTIEGELEVIQVKSKKLPDLTLDFMKTIFPEIEKEEDFREMISKNMNTELDSQSKQQLQSNATRALFDANDIEVPPSAVDNELIERFARRYGLDPAKMNENQLEALRKMHGKDLKVTIGARWLLEKIAEEEKFEANEADIIAKIEEHSKSLKIDADKMRDILEKRGELDSISSDIVIEKAMDFVIQNAEITEKEVKLGGDQEDVDISEQDEDTE